MIENVSTQLTVFHCLCPLPAYLKGLSLPLRSALFGEGGRDWRPCVCHHQFNTQLFLVAFCAIASWNPLKSSLFSNFYKMPVLNENMILHLFDVEGR